MRIATSSMAEVEKREFSEHTRTKVAQAKVALESYYETFLSEHRERQNRQGLKEEKR